MGEKGVGRQAREAATVARVVAVVQSHRSPAQMLPPGVYSILALTVPAVPNISWLHLHPPLLASPTKATPIISSVQASSGRGKKNTGSPRN